MKWTVSILTIPERFEYLEKLLDSLTVQSEMTAPDYFCVNIICNRKISKTGLMALNKIVSKYESLKTKVYMNEDNPTISGGRQFALACALTPLIVFIDDDCSLHGNAFVEIEKILYNKTVAFVGLRSYQEGTEELFKPRANTPSKKIDGLLYMPIQGMFVAGYTSVYKMLGGFNLRRKFWGEWTEFNLRALRNGYPSAYLMNNDCFIRHWHKAPNSPTRNMEEREINVLWGLMCTALEYRAIKIDSATETFWDLVERRYLQYSFGDDLSYKRLFSSFLKLLPMLIDEWDKIKNYQITVSKHKFQFSPFHDLSINEYNEVLDYANLLLKPVKTAVFSD